MAHFKRRQDDEIYLTFNAGCSGKGMAGGGGRDGVCCGVRGVISAYGWKDGWMRSAYGWKDGRMDGWMKRVRSEYEWKDGRMDCGMDEAGEKRVGTRSVGG